MFSKNIDFYKERRSFVIYRPLSCSNIPNQLSVAQISGQANINYGEICDILYSETFQTGAIKMKRENSQSSFLSLDKPENNLVPFSFDQGSILVLTCSLAFLGSIAEDGSQFPPEIVNSFEGVVDCFFQEKKEGDIVHPYFTDSQGFRQIGEEEPDLSVKTELNINEKECPLRPIYAYDIDIPIYGNGIQYLTGPISFRLEGPFEDGSEFAAYTSSCGNLSFNDGFCDGVVFEDSEKVKWFSYIKVEEFRVINDN